MYLPYQIRQALEDERAVDGRAQPPDRDAAARAPQDKEAPQAGSSPGAGALRPDDRLSASPRNVRTLDQEEP